jgi:hypothetical protein
MGLEFDQTTKYPNTLKELPLEPQYFYLWNGKWSHAHITLEREYVKSTYTIHIVGAWQKLGMVVSNHAHYCTTFELAGPESILQSSSHRVLGDYWIFLHEVMEVYSWEAEGTEWSQRTAGPGQSWNVHRPARTSLFR